MIPQLIHISTQPTLHGIFKPDKIQPGQMLILVVDGIPYSGQRQINGKPLKLLRKGRDLQLQIQGLIAFSADNFFTDAASSSRPDDGGNLAVPTDHSTDSTAVDIQTLLQEGSAVQIAAVDRGLLSDASNSVLGQPWQSRLVAQAPDTASTTTSKSGATLELAVPSMLDSNHDREGYLVLLMAGLSVALVAGRGGASQSLETFPVWLEPHDETSVPDWIPDFGIVVVSSATFAENGTGAVYTAAATPDVTGASMSYSIGGGADSAKFSINSSSGVVGFVSSPDFETPTDAGGDNVYDLIVSATEVGNTFIATRSVAVTVTDVGDVAPAFSSASSATFAENGTGVVYTAVATPDVTGASMSYSIGGGADSAKFSINSSSGVVGFKSSPDFETPTDAGGDNVYNLVISATEVGNTFIATRSVAVTVTDVGDVAPVFGGVSSATFTENGTGAVYTAVATPDVTGASISYSISGGTDSAKFSINSNSGVVGFKSSPDFETPTDAGSDNIYNLVISATEVGNTFIATRSVAVTVTDVGDVAPAFSSASSTTFTENGTGAVYTAVATPDVTGASISYSISGGTDSAKFSINSSSGVVGFKTSPDFETPTDAGGDNVYDLIVSATEVGNTFIATRSVAVTVTDVGDVAPAFSSASSTTFAENGTGAVYTAAATPDVTGAGISYSISGGTDSAKFSINSSSGVVGFVSSPDFETPTDAGGDNVYNLVISATESGNTRSATQSVAVTVTDVGDVAPAFSSASSTTFTENGTGAVYTAVATPDVTGAGISYSISGGTDSAKFSINSNSGVVGFVSSPDFETPTDAGGDNVYDLIVSATEVGNTFIATRSVAVTVQDVNELAPSFASGNSASFAENGTGVAYTALATPRVSGSMSYSISGGADSAQFSINSSSGVVGFVSSPDFETPTDAGGDNVYDLIVSATEVGNTFIATRSVAVTVSDVGDVAPLLSSGSSATFAENGTGAVYTAATTPDVTGAGISYSISGGTDSAQFSINSSSGVVGFVSSPDFETPTDAGGDNVYDLIVSATEVGNTFIATRSVAVTVQDVNELAPSFASGNSASFAENGTGVAYTALATPRVSGSMSYSISGGADSAQFSINSSSGVVGFVSSPDFETPNDAGGDNVYDLIISATESGNTRSATQSVAVTVTDVGDVAPAFSSGSSTTFAENGTGAVYTAVATPDVTGVSMSYSISGGADSAKFSINSSSGVVGFVSSPDFETPNDAGGDNVYNLVISATESGNTRSATQSVAVTVTDVGDVAPAFSSASNTTFAENGTGAVYTAVATPDVTGASISYSISGGADSAKFSINSSSGVVRFVSSPNHESPTDADSNNSYQFVVSATEAGNTVVATRSLTVTVSDMGDVAPVFTSGISATYAENATGAVYTAVVTPDVAGAAVTFAISGGADSAQFSINSSSGVVGFVSSPNHESATDSDGNNVYDLVITATEAGNTNTVTQTVAVTVTDVGDLAPVFSSASSATFAENGNGAVYTAQATPDVTGAGISYSISGGTDSAKFSINSSSGVVGFVSSPDFEAPASTVSSNVYQLVVSATEAGNTLVATRSLTVTVSDVAVEGPTFSSASSAAFAENATGAVYTAVATPKVSGASVSYSISGGLDSAKFSINSSGVVSFVSSPNHESPTDSGGNNVYNLEVKATEAGNTNTTTHSVAVTVTDVGDVAPSFTSGSSATFAENGTGAVYTAVATPDVAGAAVTFAISGGADSAQFSIDSSSGVVRFVSSPDFDTLADADSNNIYNLVIAATEANNTHTVTQSVAVTVTDVGDLAPVFTSGASISASFAENGTGAVYTAVATPDVTGAAVSYSISGGLDSARFSIDSSSGVVRFVSSPNHESPTDSGSDNVYNLVITATEAGNTVTTTHSVAVTVTDVGDVAPSFTSGSSVSFAENGTGAVYTAVVTPDVAGAAVTFAISGGADSAKFSINSSGVVSFKSNPDFETPASAASSNVYDIVITATEANNTNTVTQSVAVTVTDVGDVAPAFSSGSSTTFAENGTGAVYTAVATPDVTGAAVSYSISGGADSAQFSINSSSGVVGFVSSPDFETPTDAGGDNVYDLIISATESGNTRSVTRSVAVTVTDVGDVAPAFSSGSSTTFTENGTGAVYTAVATPDVIGASMTYSIGGGADSAKFSINSSSGVVGFVSSPDFESPTDAGGDNVYDLVIQATEIGNTRSATRSVAVTVTDVGDVAPAFSSASSTTFTENGTGAVYTAVATPDVTGASISYSISGGTDSAKFSINSSSGVVGFVSSPDFETPTDAGGDNVYDLIISATESGNTRSATRSVAVTVSDVGDVAPVFGGVSSATFAENGTGAVYTAVATPDVTGVSMSYSISGGADSAKFSINSSSGVVGFVSSPDFETPTDAGGDNVYDLIISATESGNTRSATRSVAVTVTDVGDVAPAFSSGSSTTFTENGTGAVYTAVATPDVTGAGISYSISGGTDSAKFSINSSSGVVGFVSSPDFETPTDAGGDNVYDLIVSATEVGNTFIATRSVAVTVSDVGDVAPLLSSGSSATFAENGTGPVYTAVATPDVTGASISYSISGGTDSAKFSINSSSGVVGFVSSPDFETPTDAGGDNVYNLVISATEVGNTFIATRSVAVTVSDVGDVAPAFSSGSSATFAENGTGVVYTAVATPDVTGASISYSISGGTDSAKFSINSSSGVVGFVSSPDFETPTDAGGDNVYDLVISATEVGNTFIATRSVAVTVQDVNELAPSFASGNSASFAENGTGVAYTALATPRVSGSMSYSISGGADSAQFSINSSSGVVGFVSSPDFETPNDAGGDNVYNLVISATESGNTRSATQSVAVTVTDVGDVAPAFSSGSSTTFAENGTGAVYTAVATPDVTGVSMSYSISGGADSAKFSINSSSGVVGFVSSPDFETPADADSNNSYQFVVSATEAGNTVVATRSLTVTVSDVGDVAPVFTSANSISASFAENGTGAIYTAQATPDAGGAVSYSISGGDDSTKFSINSSSGVVGFVSSPDFETPTDAGGDNVYNLVISATEVGNTFIATRSVAVTVSDVGDVAPAFSSGSSATFAENGTGVVYTAVATPDVTGASISYSISGGTDSAKFSINSSSGVVGFVSSPDFETPTDAGGDNVYNLVISATEVGNTFIATRSVAVTVSDVGDVAPAFSSGSSTTFAENGTGAVYTAVATPDVTGASISYSISGGTDSAKFSINSNSGVVGFKSSPDFETPNDAGGDNVYDLIISATESGNTRSGTQSVVVTVSDVGDVAPVFGGVSSATFAENGTGPVYTAVATPDVTGASISYSISGGADSAQFSINSSSGVVGFVSSPDFETPTDAGGDNVYNLVISATEVGNTFIATRSVAVTVTDVGDVAPAFSSASSTTFTENGTGAVYTAVATPDVTGAGISYSISGGLDAAQFSINSSSGVVGFVSSPDFETPTDAGGDNVYNLVISATESGNTHSATRSVTVTVINVAEAAPGFTSGSSTTFTENGTGAVYTAVVTPDVTGAGISYSISGGADSAKFSINSSSGVVGFKSSPDFETPTDAGGDNVYNLVISATESSNTHSATRSVAVTVINVAEAAPGFTSGSSVTFAENGTGAVYTAVATPDVTGASMSYSISGGLDAAKFSINSSSGVVGFKSSPDFETPTDAGGDNVYNLVIRATEIGNTSSATRSVAVTVQDVADVAPNFTSASSATFAENGTGAVYTAVATPDVTGVGISYSINGGADSAKFSINSSSGVVSFKSGPDYEAPTDAGSNNIYDIIIHAIEANNTHVATRSVAVTVQNIDDTAPKVLLDRNRDTLPQVMALGTGGEYVVAWQGQDNESAHDTSIYVQKFAANSALSGTRVQLEGNTGANPQTSKDDTAPQLAYIGSGRYAVVWHGFNADAIPTNAVFAQLLGTNLPIGSNRFSAITLGSISDAEIRQPQVVSPSSDTYVVVDTGPGAFGSGQGVKVYMIKNGIIIGSSIELRDGNYYAGHNDMPQVTAVGTSGEFVVVWRGHENSVEHDYSIFVQRFDTNKAKIGSAVKLEAISKTDGNDQSPQITAVGTSGEYVVVWSGQDDSSPIADYSIFVQKFNANGTTSGSSTQLEAIGKTDGKDAAPQVTAVGTSGEYVVVWAGEDGSGGDTSIFVQKFNASGATSGNTIQLEAIGKTDGDDETPRVTAVGTSGEFVVVWAGEDSLGGDVSIFVQKFDANGSISGSAIQLEPNGKTDGKDQTPQVTAVGTSGEFVVVWTGEDVAGSRSVFVQKIASDGNLTGSNVLSTNRDINLNIVLHVQSDETGKAYLVKNDIDLSAGIAALTQANESQWNEVAIAIANTNTVLNTNGLVSGIYDLYAVDAAGNWSIPILSAVTVI